MVAAAILSISPTVQFRNQSQGTYLILLVCVKHFLQLCIHYNKPNTGQSVFNSLSLSLSFKQPVIFAILHVDQSCHVLSALFPFSQSKKKNLCLLCSNFQLVFFFQTTIIQHCVSNPSPCASDITSCISDFFKVWSPHAK